MKPTALLGVLLVLAAAAGIWLVSLRATPVTLSEATLMQMGAPGNYGLSLKIANEGGPDRLMSVQSAEAERVMVMGASTEAGLPVPAGATPSLSEDGVHGMLMGLDGEMAEGRLVPVTLVFEQAGEVSTRARIVGGGEMDHGEGYAVPPVEPAPGIALSVTKDGDGWVATVETSDFRFARDLVDGPHAPGTGHGHVYLAGLKLQRLYEPEFRLGALPPGEYELRVTLNTNDHRTYMVEGAPVTAAVRVGTD